MNPMSGGPTVRIFIQARMSSKRLPGKVLAPFAGRPMIAWVVERVAAVLPKEFITVLTSTEESDDPLALYLDHLGISYLRGPLGEVFSRFQLGLERYPCDWFIRISGDSPLYDSSLIERALAYKDRQDIDLVTNIYPRTFARGHSIEMLKASTFAAIDPARLTAEEQEHVTKYYYNHAGEFNIVNIESGLAEPPTEHLAVDTLEDFYRLERLALSVKDNHNRDTER